MTKWILVLVAALAISLPSLAQDKDKDKDKGKTGGSTEQQIKALDEQYRQALLKNDVDFLNNHLADNYFAIGPNGQEISQEETVRTRREGKVHYEAIDFRHTKIHVYGNTAIVEHDAHVKGDFGTTRFDGNYRNSFVWVKQGNQWKLASFQATPEQANQAATNK